MTRVIDSRMSIAALDSKSLSSFDRLSSAALARCSPSSVPSASTPLVSSFQPSMESARYTLLISLPLISTAGIREKEVLTKVTCFSAKALNRPITPSEPSSDSPNTCFLMFASVVSVSTPSFSVFSSVYSAATFAANDAFSSSEAATVVSISSSVVFTGTLINWDCT